MKKGIVKAISLFLALVMLFGCYSTAFATRRLQSTPRTEELGAATPFRVSTVVNGDPATQRGICWYTKSAVPSVIKVFDSQGNPASVSLADVFEWEGNFCHKAVAKSLVPGETYTYVIGSEDDAVTGRFTTDDKDNLTKFIAIADVQAGNANNMWRGANTLIAALETMPDADFVANNGDFTNDSDNEEWDLYDEYFRDINRQITLAPVTGNHDGFARAYWYTNFFNLDTSESVQTKNGVNYSFDYGDAHFAVVNTNDLMSISLAQQVWLKNDLNSTDKDWKIVLMHKSPYTFGKDGKWPDALYLQKSLTAVCDMCGVDLVISGHDHQYLRTKKLKANRVNENGTTYVLAGTAGTKRYEVRSFLEGLFVDKDVIANLTIQKNGYGNYWNGKDWNSTNPANVGGCFNTVEIEGGKLVFNSYILSDDIYKDDSGIDLDLKQRSEYTFDDYAPYITNTDSLVLEKETGKNKITFTGDNTTSEAVYILSLIPSAVGLATYTLLDWLPKFLINIPRLAYVYITEGTF